MTTAVILEGTLRADGTVELDSKPGLSPGRVQVALQPLPAGPPAGTIMAAGTDSRATVAAYPSADFYEPVELGWTEAGYEVRQALKEYSEATHADHPNPSR